MGLLHYNTNEELQTVELVLNNNISIYTEFSSPIYIEWQIIEHNYKKYWIREINIKLMCKM